MKSIIATILATITIAGCGPNWDAIQESQERELEAHERWADNMAPLLQPPGPGAGEFAHVAYQVRLAYVGQTLQQMKPETMQSILAYAKSKDDQLYRILSLALNNPFSNAYANKWAGSSSGGNQFVFGGDDAKNHFSNFDFTTGNQSPFVAGDDNQTGTGKAAVAQDDAKSATNDGQVIEGEGNTQGQAISRPNTQNDLDFAVDGEGDAGDNNINSEGFGVDGSLLGD